MEDYLHVLKDITFRLSAVGIPYMITGSLAMAFYSTPRMTRDIDIVVVMAIEDVADFLTFIDHHYYFDRDSIETAIKWPPHLFNLIHDNLIVKVDLILREDNEYGRLAFERRLDFDLLGQTIQIITPEDLIIAKVRWAKDSYSEIQLKDVKSLLKKSDINFNYIEEWIDKFRLETIWQVINS